VKGEREEGMNMTTRNKIAIITLLAALCFSARAVDPGVYSDNIVVVLDASGSMGAPFSGARETKMSAAKSALKQVLLQSPATAQIGVLVFSAKNTSSDWVYPLGPRDDARLSAAISLPEAGMSTPLGKYMKLGADCLLRQREKQFGYGSYRLLIVTDGQADDRDAMENNTREILARGICIDVIGVDMADEHLLARSVHAYRRADDPASLTRAVRESLAEISNAGRDTASADDFALLAGIPFDMAMPMLQALSDSGNQPIGERAIPRAHNEPVVYTSVQHPPRVQPPVQKIYSKPRQRLPWVPFVILVIVASVILNLLFRKKSQVDES
jgi:hypothetical protein